MSSRQLFVPLSDADTLVQKLLDVGNSLKPIDDANYYLFEIVREVRRPRTLHRSVDL